MGFPRIRRLCCGVIGTILCCSACVSLAAVSPQASGARKAVRHSGAGQTAQQDAAIWKVCSGAVFGLKCGAEAGTGFLIANGQLLTSYHLIRGASEVTATAPNGKNLILTRLLSTDPGHDIAVLAAPTGIGLPIKVDRSGSLPVGSRLTVLSSSPSGGLEVTECLLNARTSGEGRNLLQLSTAALKGAYGAPVLNASGWAAGMVLSDSKQPAGRCLAVDLSMVHTDSSGVPLSLLAGESTAAPAPTRSRNRKAPARSHQSGTAGEPEFVSLAGVIQSSVKSQSCPVAANAPDFAVSVQQRGDSPVEDRLVRKWVLERLAQDAPQAKIIPPDQQERAASDKPADMLGWIKQFDSMNRVLDVEVDWTPHGRSRNRFYVAHIEFKRGAILPVGASVVTVWEAVATGLVSG
ncbi:MAG TPA: serine protease, partial [Chthonomonadales bacterium]|nr:serine protease [Chthonomonadales bacterium]